MTTNIHPLPWHVVISHYGPEIYSGPPNGPWALTDEVARVNTVFVAPEHKGRAEADAAFITHACNTHEQLVAALNALHTEFMSRMDLVRESDWTPEEIEAEEQTRAALAAAKKFSH